MGLLLLSFLVGCAPVTTLEELEAQAYVSGDWSAVDKRERMIARREARMGPTCPGDAVARVGIVRSETRVARRRRGRLRSAPRPRAH